MNDQQKKALSRLYSVLSKAQSATVKALTEFQPERTQELKDKMWRQNNRFFRKRGG